MEQLYAYHATPIKNKKSIEKNGLLLNQQPINKNTYYVENQLFFTFVSGNKAKNIVQEMLKDEGIQSEIIVYRIPLSYFNIKNVHYDYNVKCIESEDIETFSYAQNIPFCEIEIVPQNEMDDECTLDDLLYGNNEVARDIGEKLFDIWKEEISWLYDDSEEY